MSSATYALEAAKLLQTTLENDIAVLRREMAQEMAHAQREKRVHQPSRPPPKPGSLDEHAQKVRHKRFVRKQEEAALRRGGMPAVRALHDAWDAKRERAAEIRAQPDLLRAAFAEKIAEKQAHLAKAEHAVKHALERIRQEREREQAKDEAEGAVAREAEANSAVAREAEQQEEETPPKYRPPRTHASNKCSSTRHARPKKTHPKWTQRKRSDAVDWRSNANSESARWSHVGSGRSARRITPPSRTCSKTARPGS